MAELVFRPPLAFKLFPVFETDGDVGEQKACCINSFYGQNVLSMGRRPTLASNRTDFSNPKRQGWKDSSI